MKIAKISGTPLKQKNSSRLSSGLKQLFFLNAAFPKFLNAFASRQIYMASFGRMLNRNKALVRAGSSEAPIAIGGGDHPSEVRLCEDKAQRAKAALIFLIRLWIKPKMNDSGRDCSDTLLQAAPRFT